jgi:hypothetical protein
VVVLLERKTSSASSLTEVCISPGSPCGVDFHQFPTFPANHASILISIATSHFARLFSPHYFLPSSDHHHKVYGFQTSISQPLIMQISCTLHFLIVHITFIEPPTASVPTTSTTPVFLPPDEYESNTEVMENTKSFWAKSTASGSRFGTHPRVVILLRLA